MKNLKKYKLNLIKALQNIDIKVVEEIESLIYKKITQGRQFLLVVMVVQLQFRIIFYAILIKVYKA